MRKTPNFYAVSKGILSSSIIVHDWWKKPYDLQELLKAFGQGALQRGVQAAQAKGETIPADVLALIEPKWP